MNRRIKISIIIFLGALLFLMAAYVNVFPIVYSDTATYLASGFELETPFDRPITYGLFLRLSSLNGASLWFTILLQSLILSFLIFMLCNIYIFTQLNIRTIFISIMVFLSLFTSVSWTASQLISDIFTPIMLLSLLILVIEKLPKRMEILLYFIFLLSTTMHISHITFNILFILSILIIRQLKFLGVKEFIKLKPLLICFCLSLLSIATVGSALSKSKHGFLMGALVEHGIAKIYLDDKCEDIDYKFCAYKDSLPDKAWMFLWNNDSPFYKMGSWKGTKVEYNEIIYQTLTTPKYIILHFKESIKATVDQLLKFNIGDGNGSFLEGTLLHKRISIYFNHEIASYESSRQNTGDLTFINGYNKVLLFVVLVSIVVLFLLLFKGYYCDKKVLSMILIVVVGVIVNAWVCGTLANAIDRLGSKVIWLIPLISIIGVIRIYNTVANKT